MIPNGKNLAKEAGKPAEVEANLPAKSYVLVGFHYGSKKKVRKTSPIRVNTCRINRYEW